jgi:hypothetical protein
LTIAAAASAHLREIPAARGSARLECRLLLSQAEMLTWTELVAYLSVVAALCGAGVACCWALLWKE